MTTADFKVRLQVKKLCQEIGLNYERFRKGNLTEKEKDKLAKALKDHNMEPLSEDPNA